MRENSSKTSQFVKPGDGTGYGRQAYGQSPYGRVPVLVQRKINEFCTEPHTRALANCLYLHHDQPKMSVEELSEWLDDIGAGSPLANRTWNDFHRNHKHRLEKLVSRLRISCGKEAYPVTANPAPTSLLLPVAKCDTRYQRGFPDFLLPSYFPPIRKVHFSS